MQPSTWWARRGTGSKEVATGEVTDPDEVLIDYGDHAWERVVIPAGRLIGLRRTSRETRIAWSQLVDLFQGRARPQESTRELVTAAVVAHAMQWFGTAGSAESARRADDEIAVLALFLAQAGSRVRGAG